MGAEQKNYNSGNERVVFTYKGFRILPQVCYDLRFPVWSRNKNDYDVLVCMANWPAVRQKVWDVLLSARAIENQSYVIGVNRVGVGGGLSYNGGTKVVNFKGDVIIEEELNKKTIIYSEIDLEKLQQFKKKFPAYLDADDFIIT